MFDFEDTSADWRADNIRVSDDGDRLVAIYDWDSVRLDGEAHAIGEIAAMHSIDYLIVAAHG